MAQKKEKIEFEQPSEILIFINRYSVIIFALIIIIVFALGYFFILQPKITDIQTVKNEAYQSQGQEEENQQLLDLINDLKGEYNNIENERKRDLERLKVMIPDSPQIAEFFAAADNLASENGFALLSVSVSKDPISVAEKKEKSGESVENLGDLKSMVINMTVAKLPTMNADGQYEMLDPYESFKSYLDKLENNLRLMDIQTVIFRGFTDESLVEPEDEEEQYIPSPINFDFSLVTYYK